MKDAAADQIVTLGGNRCPVCQAPARAEIDLGDYDLFRCSQCGCWSSNALARNASLSFQPEAYFANPDVDRRRWIDVLERAISRRATPASVLDIGCGEGAFLRFIGERFPSAKCVGIELEPDRARRAMAACPAADIRVGDALEHARGLDGRFDLITLWDVFEHVTSPADTLRALSDHLTADGVIFIQTIHERSIVPALGRLSYRMTLGRLRFAARRTHDAHHLVFYTKEGLARLAGDARLLILDRWFDRLALARMDGSLPLKLATALVLSTENLLGGGLFINLLLGRQR